MFREIDHFEVTRVHGMNSLLSLSEAHVLWRQTKELRERSENESWEEKFQTADATGARLWAAESSIFSRLAQTILLYQASMEAILSNVASQNESVAAAAKTGGFKQQWLDALEAVGQPSAEFRAYEQEFYKEMRIPLTHLHPNSDVKLAKVNRIDFPKVYAGVRYGWWAHIRLLIGIDLALPDIESNWAYICSRVNLPSDLFPDLHPTRLAE